VSVILGETAPCFQAKVCRGDYASFLDLSNSKANLVILEVGWSDDDVPWLDDLVGFEGLRDYPTKLLLWLDNHSAIAEGKHCALNHPKVLDLAFIEHSKSRLDLPARRERTKPFERTRLQIWVLS